MTNGMRERTFATPALPVPDETHLLRRAGLDSELADWVAGAQLIRLVGLEELYG